MAIENIIEINNITKHYKIKKSKIPFTALDNVSLTICKGEVFGLLGSNGAGKTTLIKVMAGLLVADNGIGNVLGFDIYKEHKKIRSKVSLVAPTADVGTDNNLTVRQNLEFWAVVYDLEKEQRASRIDEMLDFLNLRQYENHWPMSISAGNRQKLAVARSLLVKNPIIFLDEPTVKLDAKGAEAVRELVRKINQEFDITVILTTHYIYEAEELCDRVAIMHKGKIISCDTVANLRKNLQKYDELAVTCKGVTDDIIKAIKKLSFVISCNYEIDILKIQMENLHEKLIEVLKILCQNGVEIFEIATNERTLEDIFIDTINSGGEA